jgi:signal transduction histidine kinase
VGGLVLAVSQRWAIGLPALAGVVAIPVLLVLAGGAIVSGCRALATAERRPWQNVGWGVLALGLGAGVQLGSVASGLTAPSAGNLAIWDLVALVAHLFLVVGLVTMPRIRASRYGTVRMALDVVAGMVAFGSVAWELQVALMETGPAVVMAHAALLGAVLVAALRRSPYTFDLRLALLLIGLLPIVLSDRLSPPATADRTSVLWLVTASILGAVAVQVGRPQSRRNLIMARPARARLVLPYAPVVALGLLFFGQVLDGTISPASLLPWAVLVVVLCVVARSWSAVQENRRLVELERDQILASLSHELRTPLTAVAGFSDLLRQDWEGLSDKDRREMVSIIRAEAEALADIVGDLAALARAELDATELSIERFEGRSLVADAVRLVFDVNAPIPVKAEVEAYVELIGDRRRLVQVLKALLENAHRYGGGRILVVVKRSDKGRVIEVHDDGDGVAPKYVRHIWERFQRGEHELNANLPGSGLGLAVVRALTRAHGGDVRYRRSDRLGGACFSVDIPYDPASSAPRS